MLVRREYRRLDHARCRRQSGVSDVPYLSKLLLDLPENERTDRKSIDDTVDQLGSTELIPDENLAETGNLDVSVVDRGKERRLFLALGFWLLHGADMLPGCAVPTFAPVRFG